ncbi:MAG: hypothetical protein CMK28_00550, partial [Porticoccaceae bacterium]|nr:hypothetical protein [Porticoccaceae bacterium]
EIYILLCDNATEKGKIVIKLANDAPAPNTTKNVGRAQHMRVADDANRERKFAELFLKFMLFRYPKL